MVNLRRDNLRLLQELVDSQRMNNDVIRAALSEQQGRQHILRQLLSPPLEPASSMLNYFYLCILLTTFYLFPKIIPMPTLL